MKYSAGYPKYFKDEFGWWIHSGTGSYGPFDSKEEAIRDQLKFEASLAEEKEDEC